ncbi:MAG: DNA adenine methylase [Bacteroidales bacterium]|nr:DNA adenine methylase [Bacteroidales bacterium]
MEYNFRTLNYIGSKLRLLDFIEENVRKVTPSGSGVCDLFAGSGCVAYKLSRLFPVVANDIQGYSRIICNALLKNCRLDEYVISSLIDATNSEEANCLFECFEPLIKLEEDAINKKDVETLTDILEHGSVEVSNLEGGYSSLSDMLHLVSNKLSSKGLLNKKSLISRYFGGVFFSYRQVVQIDILLDIINRLQNKNYYDVLLAALLSTASDMVDTVGKHFAQPIKARDSKGNIKTIVYNKAIQDKTINALNLYQEWLRKYIIIPKSRFHNLTMQCDYLQCLNNLSDSVKTVYADPPYTRDHYSRFYHVLETMVLRDSPEFSTVNIHGVTKISNGLYRKKRHQSPFCIRSQAPDAFRNMFSVVSSSKRNLLLSYSPYDETKKTHPRVVSMQQLVSLAKEYFTSVNLISAGHFTHNKLNSSEHLLESADEAEVLIVCTN